MVFRERYPLSPEREALLYSRDPYFKLRKNYVTSLNWKSVTLGIAAGLIPLLLWIAIFKSYTTPAEQNGNMLQLSPNSPTTNSLLYRESKDTSSTPNSSENILKDCQNLPVLKSVLDSPNWKKVSAKTYSKPKNPSENISVHDPAEFGTYPQPSFHQVGNKTIATYHLIVTKGVISPDGFPQPALLINGQSPGPEIRVKQNSILIVNVENRLDTPLTIHFHGLHQRKSFLSDGVPHVTQNPIPPGGSFQHKINLWPQTGTYFYHAHTGMDIVWLFGPLIIEDSPELYSKFPEEYQFEEDKVFILNGVYHEELNSLVKRIVGPIHDYPTLIASITINGRSFGEWSNNISGEALSTPTTNGYDITSVKQGVKYRFRFINSASDSILSCNVSSHTFTVIETDGIYTNPVKADHIVISPGQRYSFIIKMDHEQDNYYISCKHLESTGPLNGLAVLHYFNASKPSKEMLEFYKNDTTKMILDRWVLDELVPNLALNQTDTYRIPDKLDKEYVLDVYEAVWDQRHVYLINNHYYEDPKVPYFQQLKNGVNITDNPQVFEVIEGETVQFVFQNTRLGSVCFSHPWHIHGHHFHVVGEGPNKYDPVVDGAKIQKDIESGKRFQLRDAVTVYANQTVGEETDGAYCGWAAVRFQAHNNGLWLAHCHVTPHMIMGKRFVIWEHSEEDPFLIKLMRKKYNYNQPGNPGGW